MITPPPPPSITPLHLHNNNPNNNNSLNSSRIVMLWVIIVTMGNLILAKTQFFKVIFFHKKYQSTQLDSIKFPHQTIPLTTIHYNNNKLHKLNNNHNHNHNSLRNSPPSTTPQFPTIPFPHHNGSNHWIWTCHYPDLIAVHPPNSHHHLVIIHPHHHYHLHQCLVPFPPGSF